MQMTREGEGDLVLLRKGWRKRCSDVFSTRHVIQIFLITRRKVGERFAQMWRKQWLQIRNDSPLLILFLDVSNINSAKGLAKEVVG